MKLLMTLGGLIGFGLGLLTSLVQGCAWPEAFGRACVAALVAGIVLRWWGQVWANNLQKALEERAQPQGQASTPATPTQPSSPSPAKA